MEKSLKERLIELVERVTVKNINESLIFSLMWKWFSKLSFYKIKRVINSGIARAEG